MSFFFEQYPSGVYIHPSGNELTLCDCANALGSHYGDKQGKKFRVWLDRVFHSQIGTDTWLVKFNKWEICGETYYLAHVSAIWQICSWWLQSFQSYYQKAKCSFFSSQQTVMHITSFSLLNLLIPWRLRLQHMYKKNHIRLIV